MWSAKGVLKWCPHTPTMSPCLGPRKLEAPRLPGSCALCLAVKALENNPRSHGCFAGKAKWCQPRIITCPSLDVPVE